MIERNQFMAAVAAVLIGGMMVWSQEPKKDKQDEGEQERVVKESEVPAAALAALKKLAGSASITEFAEEIEHGAKFFEGSWKGPDGNVDGLVTESGTVVEIEESIPTEKVPAAVRAAAAKGVGEGTKISFERKTMYLYEIHFDKDGKEGEMLFTPDGRRTAEPKDIKQDEGPKKHTSPGESADKAKDTDQIPKVVMAALKAKFPNAEIRKWTREKEGNDVIFDIEFTERGRACEADIKEDGTYINYEKAIVAKDLPAAVSKAIEGKFPKATLKEIMEETEVHGKDEKLSAYEVVLVTGDMKTVEIRLAPDGKILEEEVLSAR